MVKPSISAGTRNTGLFLSSDKRAKDLVQAIISSGKKVILQPEVKSIKSLGENAIFFFDGQFSHSVNKKVMLAYGGRLISKSHREYLSPKLASRAEVELAQKTLLAIQEITSEKNMSEDTRIPLYARFDTVTGEKGPLLLEAELFEPSYFFSLTPGAAKRFAEALLRRL